MTALNRWQLAAARVYAQGQFAHVTTLAECKDVGDTLFTFVMLELSDTEGVEDYEDAAQRIETAQRDLRVVLDAIDNEGGGARS